MQHVFPLCCIISVKKAQIISRTLLLTDLNGLNVERIRLPTSWNDTLTIRKINDWWKQQGSFHCQAWGLPHTVRVWYHCRTAYLLPIDQELKRWSEMYTDIHTCTHSLSYYISDVRPITEQHWTFPWPDITFIHLCLIRFQGGDSVLWWFVVCVFQARPVHTSRRYTPH